MVKFYGDYFFAKKKSFQKNLMTIKSRGSSSHGGLGGKATMMFKHSYHFSPGGSNPAGGINRVANAPIVYPWTVI